MPVLRRRFQKVDDDDVAEGTVQETAVIKTPATTIGAKKSSRDPTFRLLLETPSAHYQASTFADWDAFEETSTLDQATTPQVQSDLKLQELPLPTIPSQQEELTTTSSQDSKKSFSKVKIPPLKANRLDDIRHHRGKEVLSEVSKEVNEFGVLSRSKDLDDVGNQEVNTSKTDSDGWIPFESGFDANLPPIDLQEEQISSPWNCFADLPEVGQESSSPMVDESLPALVGAPSVDCESAAQDIRSNCSEASMPETLNIANVLDHVDKSWEQASQSDIISVDDGVEISGADVFLTLNSGSGDNSQMEVPDIPPALTEDDSEAFSLGLETMQETRNNQMDKGHSNQESQGVEGQEFLSPEPKLPLTPTAEASECSSPDSLNETRRYSHRVFFNDDENTKRYDRRLSKNLVIETADIVQDDDDQGDEGNKDRSYCEKHQGQEDHLASKIIAPSDKSETRLRSAELQIQNTRSSHPISLSPKTQNTSLLDTQSEVSGPVSARGSKVTTTDSMSETGDTMNIIIETGSFLSGDVSAITGPRHMKGTDDSCDDSATHCGKSVDSYERTDCKEQIKSGFQKKPKVKPLGASTKEIVMLNTFLRVAGQKLRSTNLSMDDREEIHRKAVEAGLPEDFVHKMLDQTAGIVRWDDQSVRTAATANSTEASSRSKHSIYSSDSHSTRYTRDDESISYDSFREMKSSSTEFDEGAYGCFEGFKSSFWVESGLSGNDMMENVTAAFSESFDEISRCRQRRRKRRTSVFP